MRFTLLTLLVFFSLIINAQEICNNGIDDDNDGLIDLNDSDCDCEIIPNIPPSLIPNPSFEDHTCIPNGFSTPPDIATATNPNYLDCANSWQQASNEGSADYIHTNGFTQNVPLPIPDGNACIGFMATNYTGQFGSGTTVESVAACLIAPLPSGTDCTISFDFATGFNTNNSTTMPQGPYNVTIYGTPNCNDIPWSTQSCPSDNGSFVELGYFSYTPNSSWENLEITFTAPFDVEAIAISGPCDIPNYFTGTLGSSGALPYFYLDNIVLNQTIPQDALDLSIEQTGGMCAGDLTITSSTTNTGTYQWYLDGVAIIGETNSTLNVATNGYAQGEYTLVLSVNGSCITESTTVVGTSITTSISSDVTLCSSIETTITATGGTNYLWDNGLAGNPSHTVSPTTTTTYSVTISDDNDCSNIETVTVTISNDLFPSLISNYNCLTNSYTLLLDTVYDTYAWSTGSTIPNMMTSSSNTYSVTVSENGCQGNASINITIPEEFNLELTPVNETCYGYADGQIMANVSGGTLPHTFLWNNSSSSQNINNLSGGLYSLTVTDANNCIVTSDTSVLAIPAELNISENVTNNNCFGENNGSIITDITGGTPPYTYSWTHGLTTENINYLMAGTYSLTVSDANNCTSNTSVNVTEPNAITVSLPANTTICKSTDFNIQSSLAGGTEPYEFLWSNNSLTDNITINITDSTSYTLTVTDNNNCSVSQIISVNTYSLPSLTSFADKDTVCPGDPVLISSEITGGREPYIYTINNNVSGLTETVYPDITNTYNTQVIDACNNTDNANISIFTYYVPVLSISSDILNGCEDLVVNFNEGNDINTAIYSWDFGDNNNNSASGTATPKHIYEQAGIYTVSLELITEDGCRAQQTITNMITVYPTPNAMFEIADQDVSFLTPTIAFTNYSTDNYYNYWNFGDGAMSNNINPTHKYNNIDYYNVSLIVESIYGCLDSAIQQITINNEFTLYAPTAFSPDNDNINDGFKIVGNGIDTDNFELRIYDRWGEIIWKTNDMYEEWNGSTRNNNKKVQNGTYVWLVVCNDFNNIEQTKSGTVTVIK